MYPCKNAQSLSEDQYFISFRETFLKLFLIQKVQRLHNVPSCIYISKCSDTKSRLTVCWESTCFCYLNVISNTLLSKEDGSQQTFSSNIMLATDRRRLFFIQYSKLLCCIWQLAWYNTRRSPTRHTHVKLRNQVLYLVPHTIKAS